MTRFSAGDLQNMSQSKAVRLINDAMNRLETVEKVLVTLVERVKQLEERPEK
jgi:hypothetical protein